MPRPSVSVRAAVAEDLPELLRLYEQMRGDAHARGGRTPEQHRAGAEERYREALASPDTRMVVAVEPGGDRVVGMALLTLGPLSALVEGLAVVMSQVQVTPEWRRRGAGRALVAVAAQFAEERGAESVSVGVLPQARDSQRFYARLGFAPLVVRRAAPLAVLRRRLGADAFAPPVPTVGEAVHTAQRRGVRARTVTARAVASARRRSA